MLNRPPAPSSLNSDSAERLRSRFYRHQGVMHSWGAQLTVLDPGHVEIQIPISERILQHRGYVHGGVVAALGDNACGLAYASLLTEEEVPLTVELKINYVAPSIGELLIGRGSVMHCSERIGTVEGEIYSRDAAGAEHLSASVLATMIKVPRSDTRDGAWFRALSCLNDNNQLQMQKATGPLSVCIPEESQQNTAAWGRAERSFFHYTEKHRPCPYKSPSRRRSTP